MLEACYQRLTDRSLSKHLKWRGKLLEVKMKLNPDSMVRLERDIQRMLNHVERVIKENKKESTVLN